MKERKEGQEGTGGEAKTQLRARSFVGLSITNIYDSLAPCEADIRWLIQSKGRLRDTFFNTGLKSNSHPDCSLP